MLRAHNISYAIGDKLLVKDINLTMKAGEVNVIMGQNGAGKSTLLKILAGSIKHYGGEALINNRNILGYSQGELAKLRAVLSQHYEIFFPITVDEIVMMGRYPHFKSSPGKIDIDICIEAMELMGILELRNRDYNTLSGGEAQKTQMARVLAQIWQDKDTEQSPKILFLDEPVSSLDLHYQHHIMQVAKDFAARGNLVAAVLHDINLAVSYAERIIFMKDGKILKCYNSGEKIENEVVSRVFDIKTHSIINPVNGKQLFVVNNIS